MKRILLRSAKSPFEVISPEVTVTQNRIATNIGNLVFSHAAHRLLSTPDTEVVSNGHRFDPNDADRINEEFDVFVVPLANAFRPGYTKHLTQMVELVERLTIPVVVFGVGAQAGLDYDLSVMRPLDDLVARFARAVLERSPSIGVRGELTERYLHSLGFREVDVIGCPSMFWDGDRIGVERKVAALDEHARISINVSPHLEVAPYFEDSPYAGWMGRLLENHRRRYPNLTYIPQEVSALDLLLWGPEVEHLGRHHEIPLYASHPMYREGRIRFFVDPTTWISFLAEQDFVFGTRIHGNIAAVLGGTPCFTIAHDSRTLELARYFELPHRKITELDPDIDARELYEQADFTAMISGHKARFETLVDFLTKHGLDHAFSGAGDGGFDERLRQVAFPPAVEPLADHNVKDRIRFLREEDRALARRAGRLESRAGRLETRVAKAEEARQSLERKVRRLEEERAAQERRLETLEREIRRLRRTPYWWLRRRVGRVLRALRLR